MLSRWVYCPHLLLDLRFFYRYFFTRWLLCFQESFLMQRQARRKVKFEKPPRPERPEVLPEEKNLRSRGMLIDAQNTVNAITRAQNMMLEEAETEEQKIARRTAKVNKHLVLRKNYNDYLVSLFSEDPRVLIDRYYPAASEGREAHPSRQGALDALAEMEREAKGKSQAEINNLTLDFIEKQIVSPIAYLIFMLVTEQETKWGDDMKGTGPLRDVNKSYDYTLTDLDLDNVFRYYLGDVADAASKFTGTPEEIQAQINEFKAKNDPLVLRVEANEYVNEESPLYKFGLSGYLGE